MKQFISKIAPSIPKKTGKKTDLLERQKLKRNVLKRFVQEEFGLKEGLNQREMFILRKDTEDPSFPVYKYKHYKWVDVYVLQSKDQ
tara:strand:- start:581 stop:838 length:258 start_codon:yes stop_codon:yes gene_type:complete